MKRTALSFAAPDDVGHHGVLSPVARSTAGPFRPCDAGPLRSGGDLYPLFGRSVPRGMMAITGGGVAAFHTFRQACALLPEQGE